jgi:hypothetical protein
MTFPWIALINACSAEDKEKRGRGLHHESSLFLSWESVSKYSNIDVSPCGEEDGDILLCMGPIVLFRKEEFSDGIKSTGMNSGSMHIF